MAKAASLGAEPRNRVTAVGAPSYTSGTHMWKGTAPSLKATPTSRNTRPKVSTMLGSPCAATASRTEASSSEPVTP